MQIETFVLCDAATADGGKLSILGAFDSIRTGKFPSVHPQCAIALRVRFSRIEEGEHKISIHFVNDDGKNVIEPMQGGLTVTGFTAQSSISANFIFNIQGVKLDKAGEYSIDLAIDGQHKATLPLFVREMQPPPFPKNPR